MKNKKPIVYLASIFDIFRTAASDFFMRHHFIRLPFFSRAAMKTHMSENGQRPLPALPIIPA